MGGSEHGDLLSRGLRAEDLNHLTIHELDHDGLRQGCRMGCDGATHQFPSRLRNRGLPTSETDDTRST